MAKKTTTTKTTVADAANAAPAAAQPNAAPVPEKPAPPKRKSARRAPAPKAAPAKAAAPRKKVAKPIVRAGFSNDDVALRAYYIAEKRQAAGLPGDTHSDWVEAERQLRKEHGIKA